MRIVLAAAMHKVKDVYGFLRYLSEKRADNARKNNFPRWF